MNFISKNLGWILLLFFFLFMLFIISTNQNAPVNQTLSGALDQSSGALDSETTSETQQLNNLIDKISDESEAEETIEEESSEEVSLVADKPEKKRKTFFDFFKGGDDQKKAKDTQTDKKAGESEQEVAEEKDEMPEDSDAEVVHSEASTDEKDQTTVSTVVETTDSGLAKNNTKTQDIESQYGFRSVHSSVSRSNLPGLDLETAVGKEYAVGAHSLKLNNRFFNQALAYMMRGDIVRQIGEERDGCFKIEIISSSNPKNIGKIGFVSKKYLTETDVSGGNEVQTPSENTQTDTHNDTPAIIPQKPDGIVSQEAKITTPPTRVVSVDTPFQTAIGSYYTVNFRGVCSVVGDTSEGQRVELDPGDILKQVSEVNTANGCVSMLVVGAQKEESHQSTINICSEDIVTPLIK